MKRAAEKSIWEIIENGTEKELAEFTKDVSIVKEYFNDDGLSALDLAVELEKVDMVRLLLHKKADPLEVFPYGDIDADPRRAYFQALRSKNIELKELMLKALPINSPLNEYNQRIIIYCIQYGFDIEIINLLLDNGADLSLTNNDGQNALHVALEYFDFDIVKLLIDRGANPNLHDLEQRTALHWLLIKSDVQKDSNEHEDVSEDRNNNAEISSLCEIAVLLHKRNCNVNAQDINGNTALHYAALEGGMHDIVKLLLEQGANPKIRNKKGKSPIHIAAKNLDLDCVKLLKNACNNTWAQDFKGNTPLHLTLRNFIKKESSKNIEKQDRIQLLKLTLFLLSHNQLYNTFTHLNYNWDSILSIALCRKIPKEVGVAIIYSIATTMRQEHIKQLASVAHILLLSEQDYRQLRGHLINNCKEAPKRELKKKAYNKLKNFDTDYLCAFLAQNDEIIFNSVMVNYYNILKKGFETKPSYSVFKQFMLVHMNIINIENLFQTGISLRLNHPKRHAINIDILAHIYLCTGDSEKAQQAWLPSEIQDKLVEYCLQIPEGMLSLVKNQPNQAPSAYRQ